MYNFKTIAMTLAALLVVSGLSACQQADMQPGVGTGEVREEPAAMDQQYQQEDQQEFGRTYVREMPEEEARQQEAEMTAPADQQTTQEQQY